MSATTSHLSVLSFDRYPSASEILDAPRNRASLRALSPPPEVSSPTRSVSSSTTSRRKKRRSSHFRSHSSITIRRPKTPDKYSRNLQSHPHEYRPSLNTGHNFGFYVSCAPSHRTSRVNKKKQTVCANPFVRHDLQISTEYHLWTRVDPWDDEKEKPKVNTAKLYVAFGSVCDFDGDTIVNAADEYMLGGDGVDGAITNLGGAKLDQYRREVPFVDIRKGIRCPTGEARITPSAGALRCKSIIHAVGPNYSACVKLRNKSETIEDVFEKCDYLLYDAYANAMRVANENNTASLAFSLLSCGIFRGTRDMETILKLGAAAIRQEIGFSVKEIYLVAFTSYELKMLNKVVPDVWGEPVLEYEVANLTR